MVNQSEKAKNTGEAGIPILERYALWPEEGLFMCPRLGCTHPPVGSIGAISRQA